MEEKIKKVVIAKDGWPVEMIIGRPFTNFIRKLLHGDHIECMDCWYQKSARKSPTDEGSTNGPFTN